jgi:hypothetical protein
MEKDFILSFRGFAEKSIGVELSFCTVDFSLSFEMTTCHPGFSPSLVGQAVAQNDDAEKFIPNHSNFSNIAFTCLFAKNSFNAIIVFSQIQSI